MVSLDAERCLQGDPARDRRQTKLVIGVESSGLDPVEAPSDECGSGEVVLAYLARQRTIECQSSRVGELPGSESMESVPGDRRL